MIVTAATTRPSQRACRSAEATTAAVAIPIASTAQPSIETGTKPQPNRLGPNHTLRPISGFVRILEVSPLSQYQNYQWYIFPLSVNTDSD